MELTHNEYKILHENAMKNNNGTTAFESFLYMWVEALGFHGKLIWNIFQGEQKIIRKFLPYFSIPSTFTIFHAVQIVTFAKIVNIPLKFLIEFIVICLSLVLYLTVLNGVIKSIVVSLFLITIVPLVRQLRGKIHMNSFVQIPYKYKADFITLARGVINLITAVCILAVDFKCFPRKLAKTENFGYGLMDTGVGLYVFGNGLVAKPCLNEKLSLKRFQKLMLSCTPLFVLGMVRFIVTTEIDYQVHESEYGVHWNFFITLGLVKIIGTLIESCLKNINQIKLAAVVLMVMHEAGLQLGLSNFIMDNTIPRSNFLTANKEGIFSIPGYIALYMGTLYLASFIRAENEPTKSRDMFHKALKLGFISLFLWKMVDVCEKMFGCSRRSANLGYIFWILAIGSTMVTLFMLK